MNVEEKLDKPRYRFQENDMVYSWNTIKVGWEIKALIFDDITEFAIHFLELHPNLVNQYISELMFKPREYEIDGLLKNIFDTLSLESPEQDSPAWNKEWRKWRYCLLMELIRVVENKDELLVRVEGLYADFGYPVDMVSFIYYMPSDDNHEPDLSLEDAHIRIINKLKLFLREEKLRINQGCDTLPDKIY